MRYLLDTCVFSEYSKKQPSQDVIEWIDAQNHASLHMSVVTIGEIEKGITRMSPTKRRDGIEKVLESLILQFDSRIMGLTTDVFRRWGRLIGKLELQGQKIPVLDSLLAATALEHDLTIVTRNVRDFEAANADVLNIWE